MPLPTLTLTVGLPGSGKTTWARACQAADPQLVLVSRDELRAMLHASRWSESNEEEIVAARDAIVTDALARGRSVIVHDTNLDPAQRRDLESLAVPNGAGLVVRDFTGVGLDECIARDRGRPHPVGEQVIRAMWRRHLWTRPVPVEVPGAAEAVLCDLDGTLALIGDRSPYDRTGRCIDDTVNAPVARLVGMEAARGTAVLLVSGREEVVRDATERWLRANGIPWDQLWMRPTGDRRKDAVVKREIHDAHVRGRWRVAYVIDDRPQVVRMWRDDLGLFVLDVNQAGADF